MSRRIEEPQTYILDTCKLVRIVRDRPAASFVAGAIVYKGKKKMEVKTWKDKLFQSQQEADDFARRHCLKLGLVEKENEGEIKKLEPRW